MKKGNIPQMAVTSWVFFRLPIPTSWEAVPGWGSFWVAVVHCSLVEGFNIRFTSKSFHPCLDCFQGEPNQKPAICLGSWFLTRSLPRALMVRDPAEAFCRSKIRLFVPQLKASGILSRWAVVRSSFLGDQDLLGPLNEVLFCPWESQTTFQKASALSIESLGFGGVVGSSFLSTEVSCQSMYHSQK